MEFETILYDVRDGVATITLNRPDRHNAITAQMGRDLGVRLQLERASKLRLCVFVSSKTVQNPTHAIDDVVIVWLQDMSAFNQRQRFLEAVRLIGQRVAKRVQRVGILWLATQDFTKIALEIGHSIGLGRNHCAGVQQVGVVRQFGKCGVINRRCLV